MPEVRDTFQPVGKGEFSLRGREIIFGAVSFGVGGSFGVRSPFDYQSAEIRVHLIQNREGLDKIPQYHPAIDAR